jgi:hypothetical protein
MPNEQPTEDLITAARRWYDAGCAVVPSHRDKSKRPHASWADYQVQRPTWHQVEEWLTGGEYTGIGVITGKVSGNLELVEIEGTAVADGAIDKLRAAADEYESSELLQRVVTGCTAGSAGGGLHFFIRVTDEPALPNTRLALDQTKKILAETRGEGGFAIVAPTPARTGHAPGSMYRFLTRGPEHIAEVTGEERDELHMLLRIALDDRPVEEPIVEQRPVQRDGSSPGDQYNERADWAGLLQPAGWTALYSGTRAGHPLVYWRRPGKTDGVSATTGGPGNHLYVFSSSTIFPSEQPLSLFAAYTYLNHGGDFHAAAKALAAEGYGTPAGPADWLGDVGRIFENQEKPPGGPEDPEGASNTGEGPESPGNTFTDLSWVLTGERRPPQQPEYLQTDSGHHLFYARRINGLYGDPETAKSWISMTTIAQGLHIGQKSAYLDIDHNGATEIAERLLLLGADPKQIGSPDHFRIYEPQDRAGLIDFLTEMATWHPTLVIIDSLGELMPMLGAKSIDNDELTTAMRALIKPLAHTLGACVITIDHLPKGQDARNSGYAIGGIAKKRIVDGAYYSCETIQPAAPGHIGRIRLNIEKDRHGQVRAHSTGRVAGEYVIDSTDPTFTNTRIEHPTASSDGKIKPTSAMRAVSDYLTAQPDWTAPSRNSILTNLVLATSFKRHTIDRAIDELAQDEHLTIDPSEPGKPSAVHLTRPYNDQDLTDITQRLP